MRLLLGVHSQDEPECWLLLTLVTDKLILCDVAGDNNKQHNRNIEKFKTIDFFANCSLKI